MALVVHYASVPNLLVSWFPAVVGEFSIPISGTAISTDLPDGYKDVLPFVRVSRTSGPRQNGFDLATVRLEVFALSYDDAETLANELDSLIEWNLHSYTDGLGSVLTTECISAPTWVPWDDDAVTRFMGIYRLHVASLT